jgi:hypothetical protein
LEPQEIRESAAAFAWLVPAVPADLAALIVGLTLQFTGTAIAPSMIPLLVVVLYTILAFLMFLRHSHTAQRLIAHRLGIDPKVARRIDFRGYERFDRSIAAARSAHDASRHDAAD